MPYVIFFFQDKASTAFLGRDYYCAHDFDEAAKVKASLLANPDVSNIHAYEFGNEIPLDNL